MGNSEHNLLIADISGYTRFVLKNQQHWNHAQIIISDLLQEIVRSSDGVFRLEKLEGDAAFLVEKSPSTAPQDIQSSINTIFDSFAVSLQEKVYGNACPCNACTGTSDLRLKIVLHRGHLTEQHIAGNTEVSGVAVIVAHRMLKNNVKNKHYLLLTADAHDHTTSVGWDLSQGKFKDSELGTIPYWLYLPDDPLNSPNPPTFPWMTRMLSAMRIMFVSGLMRLGLRQYPALKQTD